MKIKNLTQRNITISAPYSANRGQPKLAIVPALSTLDLADDMATGMDSVISDLVSAKVLEVLEAKEIKLTVVELNKLLEEAGIKTDKSMKKDVLVKLAQSMSLI